MADLANTMAAMAGDGFRVEFGTAYWSGSRWFANVRGKLLNARWLDPIQPVQGGQIVVAIAKDLYGQSTAMVLGGYTEQPRPSTGVVLAVGVSEIVIAGEDGVTYTTDRYLGAIGDYAINDELYITWDAAQPTILGKVSGATVTPDTPPPAPPPPQQTGTTTLIATASDTWWGPGGWGSYATSRFGGEDVYSGTWYSNTVTGAWFYGAAKPELAGKTITRVRFKLPPRLPGAGDYNSTVTIHLYAHTNGSRPGTDVNRTVGPHDVAVVSGFGGDYIDLPTTFGAVLAAGGGISIAGNPYVGFASRLKHAENGKILIDWST